MRNVIWPLEPFDWKRREKRPISGTESTEGSVQTGDVKSIVDSLHGKLKLDPTIRREIDRYLFAFGSDFSRPVSWMVLQIEDTFCYENLPDIMRLFRISFQASCPDPNIQKIFNLFLFGKRYKRCSSNTASTAQVMSATINILHGLMLGLYPFNVRHMSFEHRVKIVWTLRNLMCAKQEHRIRFIESHSFLFTLALIEYFVNVIPEFSPVEWNLMNITTLQVSNCNSICDDFRNHIECLILPEISWDKCEAHAKQCVSSVVKYFRQGKYFQQSIWRKQVLMDTVKYIPLALQSHVLSHPQPGQIAAMLKHNYTDMSYTEAEAVEEIWNTVFIRNLPYRILEDQMKVLEKYGSVCQLLERRMLTKYMCLRCALLKSDILTANVRYDCRNDTVVCDTCKHETIRINVLGRVLYVRNNVYVMCPLCLQLKLWNSECVCQHRHKNKKVEGCFVCFSKNVVNKKHIVDYWNLDLKEICFCLRHSSSLVLSPSSVFDMTELKRQYSSVKCKSSLYEPPSSEYMTLDEIRANRGHFLDDDIVLGSS